MWDAIHNWANPLKHITQHKQHKINHKCSHSRNDHPGLTADGYLFKSINLGKLSLQNWQTACIKKITWSNNYIFINSMFTCPFQLSPWVATIISTMICRHQLIWCALMPHGCALHTEVRSHPTHGGSHQSTDPRPTSPVLPIARKDTPPF